MRTAVSIFCLIACTTAVQFEYGTVPADDGYGYQSDNYGPGYDIKGGIHGYEQPQAFAAPLPVVQTVKAYDIAPVSYEDEGTIGHNVGYESGGGNDYNAQHHSAHGNKGSKGYNSKGHHQSGVAGHYGKEGREGFFHEKQGEHQAHYDEADAYGKHHESGESYKGGDHGHKEYFSKGEDITGYHKLFNKDEFKKDHDFYDAAGDSGNFKKHEYQTAHHGSKGGAYKEGGHDDLGYNKGGFEKYGFNSKGYVDEAESSHSAEEGEDSYYKPGEHYDNNEGSYYEKKY